jgi:hypothetical protein
MGGRAAVERLLGRAVPAHRVDLGDVAHRSTSDVEEDGAVGALSPVRVPADGWTRRRRAAPQRGPTRATMAGPEPTPASGISRSTHAARRSVAIGDLRGETSKCLTLLVLL